MTIKKYLHSCLLIAEKGGKLLIDPGIFSFIEKKIRPEDIGEVDEMLFTHEHADHFDINAVKTILALKPAKIITHRRIHEVLKENGIESEIISAGEKKTVGAFTIEGIEANHERIPSNVPPNLGFMINEKLFHPGDSLSYPVNLEVEVFAMPIVAPWLTWIWALETTIKLKPKIAIPIHDSIMKEFMLERIYKLSDEKLGEAGIKFQPLEIGQEITFT